MCMYWFLLRWKWMVASKCCSRCMSPNEWMLPYSLHYYLCALYYALSHVNILCIYVVILLLITSVWNIIYLNWIILVHNSMTHWCVKHEATSKLATYEMIFGVFTMAYTCRLATDGCNCNMVKHFTLSQNHPNCFSTCSSLFVHTRATIVDYLNKLDRDASIFSANTFHTRLFISCCCKKQGVWVKNAWFFGKCFENSTL